MSRFQGMGACQGSSGSEEVPCGRMEKWEEDHLGVVQAVDEQSTNRGLYIERGPLLTGVRM